MYLSSLLSCMQTILFVDRSFDTAVFRVSFNLLKKKLASELQLSIKALVNESLQGSARPYVTYLVQ